MSFFPPFVLPLLCAALAATTPGHAQDPQGYTRISGTPSEPIEFVHVEHKDGELRLGVFSAHRRLAVWNVDSGSPVSAPELVLAPRERFFRSADGRRLGIRTLRPRAGGVDTLVRFPGKDLPKPPQGLRGSHRTAISDDGSTMVVMPAAAGRGGPVNLDIFRPALDTAGSSAFERERSIRVGRPGAVQLSRDGQRIAVADDREVLLVDAGQHDVARLRRSLGFRLSPDGRVLARYGSAGTQMIALTSAWPPPDVPSTEVSLDCPTLGVEFAGDYALVRGRTELVLVDFVRGRELWHRPAGAGGHYVSAAVLLRGDGSLRVAAGRIHVVTAPHRRAGALVQGQAHVVVEVLDGKGDDAHPLLGFDTSSWRYDQPHVQFEEESQRLQVWVGDAAYLSEQLQ